MEENREIKYKIIPEFNFLYELGMPTGRKIRTSFSMLLIFLIVNILVLLKGNILNIANNEVLNKIDIHKYLIIFCIILDIITFIRFIAIVVFQRLQYKHVTYTFYEDMMTYEDDFLNQHKKNIKYKNIKEIEIRRTIWDRILNYGIMVIYTNADNYKNNGLVIYSIRNPKKHYEIIDKLVHMCDNNDDKSSNLDIAKNQACDDVKNQNTKKETNNQDNAKTIANNYNISKEITTDKIEQDVSEEEFRNSLKNINE